MQQVGNSISELEKLYGRGEAKNVGTKQDLSLSSNSTAFGKLQGKGDAAFKSFTDSGYQEDLNRYNAQLTILKGVFTQALGSGAPTGQEGVDLINSAPGADATDEEAKGWFESIRNVAGVVQKELGQPGTNQKKNDVTSGFQNIEPGAMDSIQFSGDQPQDQTSNADEGFKATDLIPILGSIIGGIGGGTIAAPTIAGIPAGVIAGGAAGAGGGEFIRQNIEGESDALNVAKEAALGGIGGPIGKGAGFIAGKTIVPAVKTGAKIAGRVSGLIPRDLIQQAIPIKPSVVEQANRRNIDIYGELLDEGIQGTRKGMADQIETAITKNAEILKQGLQKASDAGVKIDTKRIITALDPVKERLTKLAIDPKIKNPILNQITEQQKVLQGLGQISPVDAQFQKQALDDFINFTAKDPKLAQQILQTVRGEYKDLIEESIKDISVKNTNRRLAALIDAGEALTDLGERELKVGMSEIFGVISASGVGSIFGGPVGGAVGAGVGLGNILARSSPEFASKGAQIGHQIGTKLGQFQTPEAAKEALRQLIGQPLSRFGGAIMNR